MANKEIVELSSEWTSTPKGGRFCEAAAYARKMVREKRMDREEALELTDRIYRETMLSQLRGIPVGLPTIIPDKIEDRKAL